MARAKRPSIKKIAAAADLYERNLLNRNVLLVGSHDGEYRSVELRFLGRHFKHLTGVRTVSRDVSAMQFWHMCIGHRLSERELLPDDKGFAGMKLTAAPYLFQADLSAREFGLANRARLHVDAEVYSGNNRSCMGFKKFETDYFDPMTLLMSAIGKEVLRKDLFRVVGVFSKPIREKQYENVVRMSDGIDWDCALAAAPDELHRIANLIS